MLAFAPAFMRPQWTSAMLCGRVILATFLDFEAKLLKKACKAIKESGSGVAKFIICLQSFQLHKWE
jgi:shikimate kinase